MEFWLNGAGQIHAYNKDMVMSTNATENPYVLESELLSPFAELQPGQSYTWHYDWYAANVGGNFPVSYCTDMGVVSEPLRVENRGGATTAQRPIRGFLCRGCSRRVSQCHRQNDRHGGFLPQKASPVQALVLTR